MTKYIIVDVEATEGPTPASGIMTEFAAIELVTGESFYRQIYETIPDDKIPAIPVIVNRTPIIPEDEVMKEFGEWLNTLGRVTFVSDNPGFDSMWISYAFDKAGLKNPFGHSSRRIGDLYAGLTDKWKNTNKWKKFRVTNHDHTALNDVKGNREALLKILDNHNQGI